MKVLKAGLLVVVLLGLGMIAGCNEGHARMNDLPGDRRMEMDRVEWQPGLSGFPHPVVLYP